MPVRKIKIAVACGNVRIMRRDSLSMINFTGTNCLLCIFVTSKRKKCGRRWSKNRSRIVKNWVRNRQEKLLIVSKIKISSSAIKRHKRPRLRTWLHRCFRRILKILHRRFLAQRQEFRWNGRRMWTEIWRSVHQRLLEVLFGTFCLNFMTWATFATDFKFLKFKLFCFL